MRKRGFTVTEVLVVSAIVAVMLMVSLPAVMQSREAARRATCKNNLKQLGLAMHNYTDVYGMFPPAWIAKDYDAQSRPYLGWQVSILPMMEQVNVFNRVVMGQPMQAAEGILVQNMEYYRCPSDVTPATNPFRGGYGTSNYSANYGYRRPPRLGLGRETTNWPGAVPTDNGQWDRLMACNRGSRIRDITDGTANTVMIGERSAMSRAGIWPGPGLNRFEDDVVTDMSHFSRLNASATGFSSGHLGGANFVFADGSARFISEDIDSQPVTKPRMPQGIYQIISGHNDGQIVGEF